MNWALINACCWFVCCRQVLRSPTILSSHTWPTSLCCKCRWRPALLAKTCNRCCLPLCAGETYSRASAFHPRAVTAAADWTRRQLWVWCPVTSTVFSSVKRHQSQGSEYNSFSCATHGAGTLCISDTRRAVACSLPSLIRFEWKGDWSDSSPLWTAEAKAAFSPSFSDSDGEFYMSFGDFLKYFQSLSICYTHSPDGQAWSEARASGVFDATPHSSHVASEFYELTVPACAECSQSACFMFTVYQSDTRDPLAPPYIDMGVMVLSADVKTVVADSALKVDRSVCRLL
jgi:hypothetical protein